jgi:hypothetical protein
MAGLTPGRQREGRSRHLGRALRQPARIFHLGQQRAHGNRGDDQEADADENGDLSKPRAEKFRSALDALRESKVDAARPMFSGKSGFRNAQMTNAPPVKYPTNARKIR